jgi:diguanylate cyclase (GGDEF)-like protein/PAS domain S-box-containing protein
MRAAGWNGGATETEIEPVPANTIDTVLLIEDSAGDARLFREMLNDQGSHRTELTLVSSMADAERYLADRSVDIVILDIGLPDVQGLGAIKRVHAVAPRVPLVVLTGLDDDTMASKALQEGAQDYLVKNRIDTYGTTRGLVRALRYAIERKAMEDALFAEKERAQVTLNSIGEGVISTDTDNNITFMNAVAVKMLGWPRHEALGRALFDVFRVIHSKEHATALNTISAVPAEAGVAGLASNAVLVRRDESVVPIESSISPIYDREGNAAGMILVFRDVSAARASALQITHLAEHDFLTGLPNRMLLNDRINQAIASAQRHGKRVAVLFLDLDGFKHINDSLGHPIGDKLLKSIASRLVDCVRISDTVSRQGGDEFVVLLSEVDQAEDVAVAARRMLTAVAGAHSVDQKDLHITTSIGTSIYPEDGRDAETLIRNADTAMYQAKENGRQGFQFFKQAMNVRAVERQSTEEHLRRALERREFSLFYQPKICLRTGEIAGSEALLRWTNPVLGSVPPAQFIPIAEECGLILQIGAWVLREACRQTMAWTAEGFPAMSMSVNVSAVEFRGETFLQNAFAVLNETGMDPGLLELELTESVLMKSTSSTDEILQSLREKGVKVAIDDFGTGYSSLSYLRKFPVDALKIDQSFVRQINSTDDDTAIVTAVIGMAQSLGLRVVAEGVETVEQLNFLLAHHCDEAQGYYFSRPLHPERFAEFLKTRHPAQKSAMNQCEFAKKGTSLHLASMKR